jgi:hypothetical protein
VIATSGGKIRDESTYTIEVTKVPFTINFTGDAEKTPPLCIFQISKSNSVFKICFRPYEQRALGPPPTFSSHNGLVLMVFRKEGT